MEFALVLPLLVVVALALVQIGLLVRDQLVLVEAARAGAREAAVTEEEDEIRAAIDGAAASLEQEEIRSDIARSGNRGTPVTVNLSYVAPVQVPFVGWLFPDRITLLARATMRQEFG